MEEITMLQVERQEKIIDIVNKRGSVKVDYLANSLGVSMMTIRRDLEMLDKEGKVDRIYGGAISKDEVPYKKKITTEQKKKFEIAKEAFKYVKEGDAIYLDAGTTTLEIAKLIMRIPKLTVTTNDLEIARLLIDSDVSLTICGGSIQKSTGSVIGQFSNQMLDSLRFDVAFLGAMTIDQDYNVLTPTIDKASMKRIVCKNSRRTYLVVDQTKFDKEAFIKINHLSDYTAVITDKKFENEDNINMIDMGIKVIQI